MPYYEKNKSTAAFGGAGIGIFALSFPLALMVPILGLRILFGTFAWLGIEMGIVSIAMLFNWHWIYGYSYFFS